MLNKTYEFPTKNALTLSTKMSVHSETHIPTTTSAPRRYSKTL